MNNIPSTLPTVEKLIQRVKVAERSQQKEIKITVEEARDLTAELAIITTKLGNTVSEIDRKLAQIQQNTSQVDVKFDGGDF